MISAGGLAPVGRRPRLLLDVDGVLADFVDGAARALRDLGYDEHVSSLRRDRNLFADLPAHVADRLRARIGAEGFCASLSPMPFAMNAVRRLRGDLGAEVLIVTSPWPSPWWVPERLHWLEQHFDIFREEVIFTEAKRAVAGDHFVDDHDRHVQLWARENPSGVAHRWPTDHIPTREDWDALVARVAATAERLEQDAGVHR